MQGEPQTQERCMCGEFSSGTIATSFEILLWIHVVYTTVVWFILKYPKTTGIPDGSIRQVHRKYKNSRQVMHNSVVC